ncbi:MAG TPA: 3-deoxy-D-manno-octulosonic acid transferase [Elusimicrobiota bacterium]|nr:3-deoxy-D-manno-octulosonic acid transferase [Elusimicrobiota bacterium]
MLILYSVLILLFWPLVVLGMVWRYGLRRTLRGLPERFLPPRRPSVHPSPLVWVHAASVGEVRAVEPWLRGFFSRFETLRVGLTTTTVAGKELAVKLFPTAEVRLAPVDLAACVRGLLEAWRPAALVLVETELWPNWIQTAADLNVPLLLINGRISDRSLKSYLLLRWFWGPLLSRFAVVGAQSPVHAERFARIGTEREKIVVTGNLKYDLPLRDAASRPALFRKYGLQENDRVWVCGSLHPPETEFVLQVRNGLLKEGVEVKLVIAPRHLESVPGIVRSLEKENVPYSLRSQFSASAAPEMSTPVMVLDTIGELPEVYGLASWVFVGGSLVPRGGQNLLEPARWGAPVLFGPHMENFREMAAMFLEQRAAVRVADGDGLLSEMRALAADRDRSRRLGEAARRAADSQRGAVERNLDLLAKILPLRSEG